MSQAAPAALVRKHEFTTTSGAETIEVGRKLARLLEPPQLLILRGDLGTGKTTLVKGIAQALDAAEADEVTSPTFTLIHEKASGNWRRWGWTSCSLRMRWCWWSGAKSSRASARKLPGRS
jgi:hypothetical protein